jgi:hypothetical protein
MRGKRLVGSRVKLAGYLIDKIPEQGHRPDKNAAIAATPSRDIACELTFPCALDRGIADTPLILFRNLRQDSPGEQFPLSSSRRKVPLGLPSTPTHIQEPWNCGPIQRRGGVAGPVAAATKQPSGYERPRLGDHVWRFARIRNDKVLFSLGRAGQDFHEAF